MGRIPPFRKLNTEDFQDQKSWIAKLLGPLNELIRVIYDNFNKGLTFTENFQAFIKDVRVDQSYPFTFANELKVKPVGVIILKTVDNADPSPVVTNSVTCDWSFKEGDIYINNVTGLTAAHVYTIRFLVIGG